MPVVPAPAVPSRFNRGGLASALPAASPALEGVTWTYSDVGSATYTGRVDRCNGAAWVMIVPPSGTYALRTVGLASARPASYADTSHDYFATDTGQLSHWDGSAWSASAPAINNTPTLAQTRTGRLILSSVTTSSSWPIFEADLPLKIVGAELCNWNTDIPQDDTNFWTLQLLRYRANVSALIASFTTKVTNGQAISRRTGVSFGGVLFDPTNQLLSAGDIVSLTVLNTGAPVNFNVIGITLHWEPQ